MTQKTIKTKDEEQRKALNAWALAGYKGSIIAGTGFGKSRCGVLATAHCLKSGGRAIVLVPTTQLQTQFAEEFKKWGHTALLSRIDIVCYQSAHKLEGEHYEIVVCDEVHLGLSPIYRLFFEKNTYDNLLCMTATLPEEDEYKDLLKELAPTVYTITLDQCVQKGLVAPYNIYCIPVELTADEKLAYKNAQNLFLQMKFRLGGFNAFDEANHILRTKQGDMAAATQFFNAIRRRKSVVQHAENKLELARQITLLHSDEKILTFAGTNEFTNAMAKTLNGKSYHSGKTKKKREEILEEFSSSSSAILCSTKALNQGFDVPDVGVGIIAGLESKALPMIQRVGRLIRFKEGKRGRVYILYVKDSQEEKWMDQATKSLNNVQRDVSLNQIN